MFYSSNIFYKAHKQRQSKLYVPIFLFFQLSFLFTLCSKFLSFTITFLFKEFLLVISLTNLLNGEHNSGYYGLDDGEDGEMLAKGFLVVAVQSLSCVRLFLTPWMVAHQSPLFSTISQSLLKLMSVELVMPSNRLLPGIPFTFCLQSFPASGSFPVSQFQSWKELPIFIISISFGLLLL